MTMTQPCDSQATSPVGHVLNQPARQCSQQSAWTRIGNVLCRFGQSYAELLTNHPMK